MLDYDPFSDAVLDDPFPVYARLRAESPVHYLPRHESFALALFEDVWRAGEDPATFASPGPTLQSMGNGVPMEDAEGLPGELAGRSSIFAMNPPGHTQVRKALARHFSPRGVARLEAGVRSQVRDCLAKVLPRGRCDVIGELAAKVSVRVACSLIGLPLEDGDQLARVVHRFFGREPDIQGMPPDALAAAAELHEYLGAAVALRRRRGGEGGVGDDVMSAYLRVAPEGEPLSDEELASHLTTVVVGGTETLPKVFAGGVIQLHRHPDQRAELVRDPSRIPQAFDEIARYEMPTQFLTRRVARDVELRGQQLRAGQGVLLLYRSANRDEREFRDPERFDIARRPPRTLSFGHGTHVCLGQHAARLEARVMYEELLRAVPEYEVVEAEVVPARSEFVAGYLQVPIRFAPRAARS